MRLTWKIAVPIACIAAIAGAIFASHEHKTKADAAAKLAEEVRVDRLGAEQGNAEAQTSFGRLYYYGRGVPQDYAEALTWYRKAAEQDNAYAETDLGDVFYSGKAVPQDSTQAVFWYRKAADHGYARAENDLGAVYYYGRGAPQNYAEAFRWYRKAADQHDAEAEFAVGYMYRHGQGVPRSFFEGRRWYIKAAAQGNQQALGTINGSLGTAIQISLLIQTIAGLFLVSGFVPFRTNHLDFTPAQKLRTPSEKLMTTAGALLLLCAAYEWYGYSHFKFRYLVYGPNAWTLGRWLLEAGGLAPLFCSLRLEKQSRDRVSDADPSDTITSSGAEPNPTGT
jgi:hypothetical protein